jgi:hypothetical protein
MEPVWVVRNKTLWHVLSEAADGEGAGASRRSDDHTGPGDAARGPAQVAIEAMISVAQSGHKDAMRNVIDIPERPIAAHRPAAYATARGISS